MTPASGTRITHKQASVNGTTLHYAVAGFGTVVLCMQGWPQDGRTFLSVIAHLTPTYTFIAPVLRACTDGYDPLVIAADMQALLAAEHVDRFHILGHGLGGPPSMALAYLCADRALSVAMIETPFLGLDFLGYVDPRSVPWEDDMGIESGLARQMSAQASANLGDLARHRLTVPMLAWGGRNALGDHCFDCARSIAVSAKGGVIEECGHEVFEEKTDFIREELNCFWATYG